MANYYAKARSNYFKVKDKEKFEDFCNRLNVEMIEREDQVGFICTLDPDCGSLPWSIYDETLDDHVEYDLLQGISEHLQEGEVAVLQEAGHEKFRYVTGVAFAVNWKGEVAYVNINDIYKKAQEELGGEHISVAEY